MFEANQKNILGENDKEYLNKIYTAKNELRKSKQELCDERAALNRISREQARSESNFKILEEQIKENGKTIFSPVKVNKYSSDNDLIVCVSDLHIGQDCNNGFGKYDSDVAKTRLEIYLEEILKIKQLNNSENVYIMLLGDLISGNIHITTRIENRENVIQQTQKAAELLSCFAYELSKNFNNVYVNSVPGNHSRVGLKDEVTRNERLDDIIPWYMKAKLSHLDNVIFVDYNNYDETLASCTIREKEYWMCHGDYDKLDESGLSRLIMMTRRIPTGVFMGHLHECEYKTISGVKMIRSGSFCGSVDDYCVTKRLSGNPEQMVCVVDSTGVRSLYPVRLN